MSTQWSAFPCLRQLRTDVAAGSRCAMALCSERSSSVEAEVEVRCWPTGAIVMRNRRDAYRCGTIAQSHPKRGQFNVERAQ